MKLQYRPNFKLFKYVCFFSITYISFGQIQLQSTPTWVDFQSFEKSPNINKDEINYGLLTLLSDEQVHIPKQQQYLRSVTKITDNVGVQSGSLISINFDPSYQKLYLHRILVLRNNKEINKLNINDFQTIRQEANAENYIYDGSLNATANLSDIRSGDIIDVSYTIKGFNPLKKKFSKTFVLNDYQAVGKINVNLLSKNELDINTLNTDIKSKTSNKFGLISYQWTVKNTTQPEFEENTVMWHLPYQNVFVSEYKNWGQVVDWALPIYTKDNQLSKTLSNKIKTIENASKFERDRIKKALKFVQNDIRYLGLESGIGAYKPFKPNKVFEQRFGDCKDKSWLLVNILRELKIEAYPVLVNSTYGKSLHDFLPTPNAFDHVIVKVIDSTNSERFFDPTISNQEGSFSTISTPSYGNGLVIKKGNKSLETIKNDSEDLVEIFDIFDINGIGNDMTLNVVSVYHGGEADQMRNVLKTNSIKSLNKEYRDYYKNLYDEVEILKEMTFEDDSIYNKITIEESYKFDDIWKPMVGDESKIAVNFSPYSFYNNIVFPTEKNRKTPFSLYYPIHKKHKITIKLNTPWGIQPNKKVIDNDNFEFSCVTKSNRSKDILYLNYEYKNKTEFVSPEDFETFYEDTKELENNFSYYIYIPKSAAKFSSLLKNKKKPTLKEEDGDSPSETKTISIGFLAVILLGILGLVIYIIVNNRKYK